MKFKNFLFSSFLLSLFVFFTACSTDDDIGEATPKEQVVNYFPLSTGNEWEFLNKTQIADDFLEENIERLSVSDSIQKYETPSFLFSSDLKTQKQGAFSRFLTQGVLNKVEAKLVFNGNYNISLPLLGDSLMIPLENALLLHQNKSEGYILHQTDGTLLHNLNIKNQEIPVRYAYELKIIQGKEYREKDEFEQVISSQLSLVLSGTTVLPSGETIEVLPKEEVLKTKFFFAKDVGIFLNKSDFHIGLKNLSAFSIAETPPVRGWESQELKSFHTK